MRRAAIGILCLAALAIGIWWFVPRDPAVPTSPVVLPATPQALPGIPAGAFEMTVESVHDGDTLRARVSVPNSVVTDLESTRVRLIGLDTPEISPDPECWGDEATARLTALLPPGSTVWAAADLEVLDQYGRHLLYLWTPDGRFVNAELVAQGDGEVMVFAPNTLHEAVFRSLEAEASAAGRGLWSSC
ncbi:MAG: thermonuclease family protein [Microbacterium sp.]